MWLLLYFLWWLLAATTMNTTITNNTMMGRRVVMDYTYFKTQSSVDDDLLPLNRPPYHPRHPRLEGASMLGRMRRPC